MSLYLMKVRLGKVETVYFEKVFFVKISDDRACHGM